MMLDNLKKYKVILASNSPRRKELLAGLGVEYDASGRIDDYSRYHCLAGWTSSRKTQE